MERENNHSQGTPRDLEVKDALFIFKTVWKDLEEEFTRPKLSFPREIIWLGGAPGAGKGTNTPFIQKERDYTAPPIVVSSLLDSDEARKIKDSGGMVGDREVIGILLRCLLEDKYESGVIVDGFPRTQVQVECLRMFYSKMIGLKKEFSRTPVAANFRYPMFRITVLFVSEKVSIDRQLNRGKLALENKKDGEELEVRATDFNESLARNRYRTFKEKTYTALKSLRDIFHYHFVNAEGLLEEVQWNIAKEFQYQSSLELSHDLFEDMRDLPLASEMVVHTRQELVTRLEDHRESSPELFKEIISFVSEELMPHVQTHLTSGFSIINSRSILLTKDNAVTMMVDILAERGFHAAVDDREEHIPRKIDAETQEIISEKRHHFVIHINFRGSDIRRGH
jgi:adenylate kinase